MRVVLDTNVIMSALFFGGVPMRILEQWRDGTIELIVSDDILAEYQEIAERLSLRYSNTDFRLWLDLVSEFATKVSLRKPYANVCENPDDDAFIACAQTANAKVICSGDRHLLTLDGYDGIEILVPRRFVDTYLS